MTRLIALLVGAVIAAFTVLVIGVAVFAQTGITSRTLTGNEAWQVGIGGPQGPSIFVTAAQMRNSQGPSTTTTTTGTLSGLTQTTASLIFTAASVSTTVNLPASPYDGEIFEIINGTAATAFTQCTVATTDGSSIAGGSTPTVTGALAAGASTEWRYVFSTNTWYRMR